jgi:hypothetical protein
MSGAGLNAVVGGAVAPITVAGVYVVQYDDTLVAQRAVLVAAAVVPTADFGFVVGDLAGGVWVAFTTASSVTTTAGSLTAAGLKVITVRVAVPTLSVTTFAGGLMSTLTTNNPRVTAMEPAGDGGVLVLVRMNNFIQYTLPQLARVPVGVGYGPALVHVLPDGRIGMMHQFGHAGTGTVAMYGIVITSACYVRTYGLVAAGGTVAQAGAAPVAGQAYVYAEVAVGSCMRGMVTRTGPCSTSVTSGSVYPLRYVAAPALPTNTVPFQNEVVTAARAMSNGGMYFIVLYNTMDHAPCTI